MGTMIQKSSDVIGFLKEQHQQVKGLFEEVLSMSGKERAQAFYKLRRTLAVHEAAEEEIVHPAARKALQDGEAIVGARLKEENEAKATLAKLEALDVDSIEFLNMFTTFKAAVLAHAESEETLEFDRLAGKIEPERLERMKKAAELAEQVAPTRPHAGIESRAGNLIVGPFASMIDRARDAFSGKSK